MVEKAYDFTLWLLPKVEKFPRSYRFTVGERIVFTDLDLLMTLVEAAYSKQKSGFLSEAGKKTNLLRYLMRLSKDLKLLSTKSYAFAVERVEEIGRMVGGWAKAQRP